ncbi:beta-propeller domain-containing protein [Sphingosinicella sp. YJ22]|uniref:beta-propeller domain-containing protein n=1 Tax=Sphingosinicella sp. YJ22 TaxID=1104780 RepID=UPI00140C31B5|nr:beta-propeller domain-containing protein [Sphingosinicella sp. YJ22]
MRKLGRIAARRNLIVTASLAAVAVAGLAALGPLPGPANANLQQGQSGGLVAFRSDDELRSFLRQRQQQRRRGASVAYDMAVPAPAAPAATAQESAGLVAAEPGITNTQEAGVDEGGIVKTYRDMLVILRRGRIFTVSLADGSMRPIDSIDAFPPGVNAGSDWYDEMLVAGDRVIVIGYSYGRGGTEVNRFRISPDGRLRFEDAYHLRSNDYYSSRNYASRLIGNRLVYYTPLYLGYGSGDPLDALPAVRRWRGDNDRAAFRRIADSRRVYIAPRLRDDRDANLDALHSVISCDLTAPELDCDATAVLGPSSRTFYVSGNAVYLWIADWRQDPKQRRPGSYLYRLPFDEEARPAAIAARGAPTDQFSFREDAREGRVDVLVRSEGGGDAMWRPEFSAGRVALLQVPFGAFGDGSDEAPARFYRDLPPPRGAGYEFHNRFVGDYVLYGTGGSYGRPRDGAGWVTAASVSGGPAHELALAHDVERIEVLGRDALVVGGGGRDLGFTEIDLSGRDPGVGSRYVHQSAGQGESRSHAFFYSPDPGSRDGASGTLGLPIAKAVEERYRRFFGSAATMLFLRRDSHRFSPAGELDAQLAHIADDGCRASCVDWYGNARPIFWRGRIFALLGYELVEGQMTGGRIRETARTNFAPRVAVSQRREE